MALRSSRAQDSSGACLMKTRCGINGRVHHSTTPCTYPPPPPSAPTQYLCASLARHTGLLQVSRNLCQAQDQKCVELHLQSIKQRRHWFSCVQMTASHMLEHCFMYYWQVIAVPKGFPPAFWSLPPPAYLSIPNHAGLTSHAPAIAGSHATH